MADSCLVICIFFLATERQLFFLGSHAVAYSKGLYTEAACGRQLGPGFEWPTPVRRFTFLTWAHYYEW